MAKVLDWIFRMTDRISGPAGNIANSLGRVEGSLSKVDSASGRIEGGIGKAGAAMGILSGVASAVTSKVLEFAAAVPGIALGIGKAVVEQAAFKSNTLTSLELMLKSRTAAEDLFKQVTKMANVTPFQVGDVMTTVQTLVSAGFEANKAMELFSGIGDVAALKNFDPSVLERVTAAITKMKGKGKVGAEEIMQIAEASGGVIGRKSIVDTLSQQLGRAPDVISKQLETGKISADQGVAAIMGAIQNGISGGKLGGLMDRLGTSIPGLMSTLADTFNAAIPKVEDSPGLQSFQNFLGRLVPLVDSESGAVGTRLKTLTATITNGVGGLFDNLLSESGSVDTVTAVLDGIVAAVQWLGEASQYTWTNFIAPFWEGLKGGVAGAWSVVSPALDVMGKVIAEVFGDTGGVDGWTNALQTLGKVLGYVAGVVVVVGGALAALAMLPGVLVSAVTVGIAGLINYVAELWTQFTTLGSSIVDGISLGISNSWSALLTKIAGLAAAIPTTVKSVLGIGSPSRVMFELMGQTVEGGVRGVDTNAPALTSAMQNAVQPPATPVLQLPVVSTVATAPAATPTLPVPMAATVAMAPAAMPAVMQPPATPVLQLPVVSTVATAPAAMPAALQQPWTMPAWTLPGGIVAPSISAPQASAPTSDVMSSVAAPAPTAQQFGGGLGAAGGISFGDIYVTVPLGSSSDGKAPTKEEAKQAGEAAADGFLTKLRAALDMAGLQGGTI
jgi:tape measure domain-containing protein